MKTRRRRGKGEVEEEHGRSVGAGLAGFLTSRACRRLPENQVWPPGVAEWKHNIDQTCPAAARVCMVAE